MSSSTLPSPATSRKRSLLLRDGLVFLALCGVAIALFIVTLLLFRSFEHHREELGQRWAARGEDALRHGQPAAAVSALRTALSYQDNLPAQLLLAQALAAAGRTEEATNYFLNLRETRPGDGLINLQLARLYRRQGDAQLAIDDYRAAIFGNWEGDGALRRREVRLELAAYLAERGERSSARDELLVAAGNTPETAAADVLFGDRLDAIGDLGDALGFYNKALKLSPRDFDALSKAGRLAYTLGQYDVAARLLTTALDTRPAHAPRSLEDEQLATLAANARRIPELSLSRDLPAAERAEHLLLAARIAQARLAACVAGGPVGAPADLAAPALPSPAAAHTAIHNPLRTAAQAAVHAAASAAKTAAQAAARTEARTAATATLADPPDPAAPAPPVPVLQVLRSRWLAAAPQLNKRALERDATLEDNIMQLITDTEQQTVAPCGAPHGDDALLLLAATSPPARP